MMLRGELGADRVCIVMHRNHLCHVPPTVRLRSLCKWKFLLKSKNLCISYFDNTYQSDKKSLTRQ